tara:strand:- start:859 stop:1461 length:603 start_codon:yes stop_codon:yes gene_type:complete
MNIYADLVDVDDGCAPNPFYRVMTFALGQSKIRQEAKVGDAIVGLSKCRLTQDSQVVYAGIVSDVMLLESYFDDSRYLNKKPSFNPKNSRDWFDQYGDNIYQKSAGVWKQHTHLSRSKSDMAEDIQGKHVLICKQYWYFGKKALNLPEKLQLLMPDTDAFRKNTDELLNQSFIKWINTYERGVAGLPTEIARIKDSDLVS